MYNREEGIEGFLDSLFKKKSTTSTTKQPVKVNKPNLPENIKKDHMKLHQTTTKSIYMDLKKAFNSNPITKKYVKDIYLEMDSINDQNFSYSSNDNGSITMSSFAISFDLMEIYNEILDDNLANKITSEFSKIIREVSSKYNSDKIKVDPETEGNYTIYVETEYSPQSEGTEGIFSSIKNAFNKNKKTDEDTTVETAINFLANRIKNYDRNPDSEIPKEFWDTACKQFAKLGYLTNKKLGYKLHILGEMGEFISDNVEFVINEEALTPKEVKLKNGSHYLIGATPIIKYGDALKIKNPENFSPDELKALIKKIVEQCANDVFDKDIRDSRLDYFININNDNFGLFNIVYVFKDGDSNGVEGILDFLFKKKKV